MKKLITVLLFTVSCGFSISLALPAAVLNLNGSYNCTGSGDKFGTFRAHMNLSATAKESNSISTYRFGSKSYPGDSMFAYTGEAIAHENNIAIHFTNVDPKQKDDFGTGIAFANYDLEGKASHSIIIHMHYYAPSFKGGANGSETCIKIR